MYKILWKCRLWDVEFMNIPQNQAQGLFFWNVIRHLCFYRVVDFHVVHRCGFVISRIYVWFPFPANTCILQKRCLRSTNGRVWLTLIMVGWELTCFRHLKLVLLNIPCTILFITFSPSDLQGSFIWRPSNPWPTVKARLQKFRPSNLIS